MSIINNLYTLTKATAVVILAVTAFHWCNIVKHFDVKLNGLPYNVIEVSDGYYNIDMGQNITNDVTAYKDLYDFLISLDENDTVSFKLYGYGGSVASAILVINGIKETKAKVIGDVESSSYSAHGYIACAIPKENLTFHGYSFIMLHSVQSSKTPSRELQEATAGRMLVECVNKGYMAQSDADAMVRNNTIEYYYWPGKKVKLDDSNKVVIE